MPANSKSLPEPLSAWPGWLNTAVMLLAPSRQVLWMNAAAEDLWGLSMSRPQVLGQRLLRWIEQAGLNSLLEPARHPSGRVVVRGVEFRRDSGRIELDLTITPLPEQHLLLELHVAGPRPRAEFEREQRQHLSRSVMVQLAHEVRNPLAAMRGAAQLLTRQEPDPRRRELAEIIQHEVDRLERLVDRVLLKSGPVELRPGNVHRVVERLVALLGAEAGDMVRVERDYDPSLPAIAFDHDRLLQALLNIGRNALQAAARQVRVSTRVQRNLTWGGKLHRLAAVIEIHDDGTGVPEDLAGSLFFPLVSGRPDGSGLGLSIAQAIVTGHAGWIEFDSRPGRTRFRVLLPFAGSPEGNQHHG